MENISIRFQQLFLRIYVFLQNNSPIFIIRFHVMESSSKEAIRETLSSLSKHNSPDVLISIGLCINNYL